jgi:hypothetical protein
MELSNIVYSSALIFILFLFTIFLVGFLGSQYRKFQTSYGERGTDDGRGQSVINGYPEPVTATNWHTEKRMRTNSIINYSDNTSSQKRKRNTKVVKVKSITRGSLVKEHYNARKLSNYKKGNNKNGIQFN